MAVNCVESFLLWKTLSMDSRRSPWLFVLLLIVGVAPGASAQTEPRHVLLLYSYEREFAHTAFAGMFRPELTRSSAEPVDYIEVALQTAGESVRRRMIRLPLASAPRSQVPGWISLSRSAGRRPRSHNSTASSSFPRRRCVRCRGSSFHRKATIGDNDTAVAVAHDPPQMIDNILKLLPDTKTVFVVIGASQLEQFWLNEVKHAFKRFEGRLTFVWTKMVLLGTASAMRHVACPLGDLLRGPVA